MPFEKTDFKAAKVKNRKVFAKLVFWGLRVNTNFSVTMLASTHLSSGMRPVTWRAMLEKPSGKAFQELIASTRVADWWMR